MAETSLAFPAHGCPRDLPTDSWLFAAIEEYKSIRTESLDSMKVQNQILSYGVTAVGAILTVGISIIDKPMLLLDEAIFLFFIPLVIFFMVMIWAGEVARMYRAGSFLVEREKIISRFVDKANTLNGWNNALFWENWLLEKKNNNETPHQKLYSQHYSVLGMFLFLAMLSITIGNYKLLGTPHVIFLLPIDILAACVLVYLARLALFLLRHFHPPIAPWLDRWVRRRERAKISAAKAAPDRIPPIGSTNQLIGVPTAGGRGRA
jgi:hypothetical protein